MIVEIEEDRWVCGATLALAAIATGAAELAIAEPGRPLLVSLAWAVGWSLVALATHFAVPPRPASSIRPVIILGLFAVFALPFAIEGMRWVVLHRFETLEIVLLASLRNLGLGLASLARRPYFARLAALVSLFLVLVASSLAEGSAVLVLLGVYAVTGGFWLSLTYWRRLRFVATPGLRRRFPIIPFLLTLCLIGVGIGLAAISPMRAVTLLAGFMQSSGGTSWDNPDARSGVNDGENEVKGTEKPESIGFTESDMYLDSDRPTLYDAINDMYGEPNKPKKDFVPMVALENKNVTEQKENPAENLRVGRQFSAVRKGSDTRPRRPTDREARALLYVKGPTPLHLGLVAYDRFDGRDWIEEPPCEIHCPLVLESKSTPWFRVDLPLSPFFEGIVSHQIKVGTLDSSPLPLPCHLHRFRVGQVNRSDFFGWSHEMMFRMVGRSVPSSTVIEAESRVVDADRLRAFTFPNGTFAAPRYLSLSDGHEINPKVVDLARSWSVGTDRGWAQVEAVVASLRGHAIHDPRAKAPADCPDVVAHLLLKERKGPDYLFASSAAVLLRSLGYPTRLISGLYASPDRYDPRTRHTSITREDVHVWAEVRLPDGTWISIEPTPGYELAKPPILWSKAMLARLLTSWRWVRVHAIGLSVLALILAGVAWNRRSFADGFATFSWRLSRATDPRRRIVDALRLVEKRCRWAGHTRPSGRTPRVWYSAIACGDPAISGDLDALVRLAEWCLYAPLQASPPRIRDSDGWLDSCQKAVRLCTVRRFRVLMQSRQLEEE